LIKNAAVQPVVPYLNRFKLAAQGRNFIADGPRLRLDYALKLLELGCIRFELLVGLIAARCDVCNLVTGRRDSLLQRGQLCLDASEGRVSKASVRLRCRAKRGRLWRSGESRDGEGGRELGNARKSTETWIDERANPTTEAG